jgi:hypothetical protein
LVEVVYWSCFIRGCVFSGCINGRELGYPDKLSYCKLLKTCCALKRQILMLAVSVGSDVATQPVFQ